MFYCKIPLLWRLVIFSTASKIKGKYDVTPLVVSAEWLATPAMREAQPYGERRRRGGVCEVVEWDWSHSVATLGGGRQTRSSLLELLVLIFSPSPFSSFNTALPTLKWRITARTKPRRIWTLRRTRASCGISSRGECKKDGSVCS